MWTGIAIAVPVAGVTIGALWALLRKPKRAPEPELDPDSPFTPAGTRIMRGLRGEEAPDDRLRRDWH